MKTLAGFRYLIEERGLTEETIRTFHLGYCDPRGEVYIDADFMGNLPQLDFRFYNSSIFPVFNIYNEVVGVSCRPLIQNEKTSKYTNTSYEKAEYLFGLQATYPFCIQEKTVYIMEGNLDTLTAYQKGVKNVCSMLGSNFSSSQLCTLLGFVTKTIIVPDGDMAGLNFMEKIKNTLLKRYKEVPMSFSFKMLPTGFDPDSYLKKYSKEEFLALPEVKV